MTGLARRLQFCERCGRRLRTETVLGVIRWYCPTCSTPTGEERRP